MKLVLTCCLLRGVVIWISPVLLSMTNLPWSPPADTQTHTYTLYALRDVSVKHWTVLHGIPPRALWCFWIWWNISHGCMCEHKRCHCWHLDVMLPASSYQVRVSCCLIGRSTNVEWNTETALKVEYIKTVQCLSCLHMTCTHAAARIQNADGMHRNMLVKIRFLDTAKQMQLSNSKL